MQSLTHMAGELCFLLAVAACPLVGQPAPTPVFNSSGIGAIGRNPNVLASGMVMTLYGVNLAPQSGCDDPLSRPALALCGVQVLVDVTPAELLYVGPSQINFRLPVNAPTEKFVELRVCVNHVCSAPVRKWFSTRTALLSLERPAFVHMPVWIHVDAPNPYSVSYPCWSGPQMPPGIDFAVRRDEQWLAKRPQPLPSATLINSPDCGGPSGRSSLPLHLFYQFDEPGTYSVCLQAKKAGTVLYESGWTDIYIGPSSAEQHAAWLRSLNAESTTDAGRTVSDTIPSLLAWPDEQTLDVLLKIIPTNVNLCINFGCLLLGSSRGALAWFDDDLLRAKIPVKRRIELCPPQGRCK